MTAGRPLVSVVTPVYNGEAHLRECIESVLGQTYADWDYTIVNNRSQDRTLAIAREYAGRDPRIRVHDNESFVRVIENYNIAFRQISPDAKYCKVVAADDWLFPECLEKMVRLAEEHPSVAVVGAYGLARSRVDWFALPYPSTVVSGRDACRSRLLGGKYFFGTPTAVLYRADIVRSRHAFFNEDNLAADAEACLEFLDGRDFGFVHQILTFRREDDESLTSFSESFNTYLPGKLAELDVYGPRYLDGDELRRRVDEHLRDYYRYLGRQLHKRRGRKFWSYHRDRLAELRRPLSRVRVAGQACLFALDLLLNPKSTVARAMRRRRSPPSS